MLVQRRPYLVLLLGGFGLDTLDLGSRDILLLDYFDTGSLYSYLVLQRGDLRFTLRPWGDVVLSGDLHIFNLFHIQGVSSLWGDHDSWLVACIGLKLDRLTGCYRLGRLTLLLDLLDDTCFFLFHPFRRRGKFDLLVHQFGHWVLDNLGHFHSLGLCHWNW